AFLDPSWLSMYAGFAMMPEAHDPLADHFSTGEVGEALDRMREAILAAVGHARPAREFLARLHGATASSAAA
ncbi:hypothetical protein ACKI16_46505, partial [Streptomyces scabiei]|uniref:hypothetical protein n=1 Tax=Streptomyces scabiei TaxID=1930 RepID=UPI0038F76B26